MNAAIASHIRGKCTDTSDAEQRLSLSAMSTAREDARSEPSQLLLVTIAESLGSHELRAQVILPERAYERHHVSEPSLRLTPAQL